MTITGILEECHYGDPSLRAAAKAINFSEQYGVNALASQGLPAGQLTVMFGGTRSGKSSFYQQMIGRLKRKQP